MSAFAPQPSASNFTLTPAGTHVARCCQVIYLGQHEEEYQGKSKGLVPKIRLGFELPTELHDFGQGKQEPFMIGREYSYMLGERATLRLHCESWRGAKYTAESIAKFDPLKLLGQPALITIVHNAKADGKTVAKLENITPLVKGMTVPPAILPPLEYSVLYGRNHPNFAKLPEWLQEKCSKCAEWRTPTPEEQAAEENGAETPVGNNTPAGDDRPF